MVISANQIGGRDSFVIEIETSKVDQLMDVFDGSYDKLINHLKVLEDRMVLVNPRFENRASSVDKRQSNVEKREPSVQKPTEKE